MSLRPIVVCGPSGVGKGTLLKKLFDAYPSLFALSVSHTTRKPREGEEHGKHYYFVTKEEMQKDIMDEKFIENAEFAGNLYGTSIEAVKRVAEQGKICILEIDLQGAKSVKKIPELNARFLFIRPLSYEVLESRLRGRGTETEEKITARLAKGKEELEFLDHNPGFFDHIVVNDDLDKAYADLTNWIKTFQPL